MPAFLRFWQPGGSASAATWIILEFSPESASIPRRFNESLGGGVVIRDAGDADLEALAELEARTFASDQMALRSFRRLLGRPSAALRVARGGGGSRLNGYHLVLFRKGSPVARLYSIAVDRADRGSGLGGRLLADAERIVRRRGGEALRLEVREDNRRAIGLYRGRGYRLIGHYAAYYADGADALRFEKSLVPARGRRG